MVRRKDPEKEREVVGRSQMARESDRPQSHVSNRVIIGYSLILSTPSIVLNLFRMVFSISL
jgi:hypothetical protein